MAGLMNPMPNAAPSAAPGPVPPQASAPAPAPSPAPQPGAPPQPGAAPQPGGAPQAPKGPPIGNGPLDPDLLKKYIANCMNVVTATLKQIVQMVTQAQDKVDALAHATVVVVLRVEDSLEQSGQQLNINMTFNGGAEALTDIADAMQKAGAYTYSQKEVEAAFLRAVDMYRVARAQQGRLDPTVFKALLQQMEQQEQAGTLEQSLPGLAKFAQQNKAQPQGAQPQGQDDGDGADSEDAADQQDDAQMPAPGQNFPAKLLKKKQGASGPVSVKAHTRKAKTPKPPAQKQGSNDFPAAMFKKGKPAPSGPQFKPKMKGY